jgi:hypothetical protein
MRTITADPGLNAGPANTEFSRSPICGALPGADVTDGKMLVSLSNAPGKIAILKEMLISRDIGYHSQSNRLFRSNFR